VITDFRRETRWDETLVEYRRLLAARGLPLPTGDA
jgi:hypothetical protein